MGAPGGGPFAGPSATQSSASAGLPFAGVPSEMQEGASEILKKEPIHPEPVVSFHRLAHSCLLYTSPSPRDRTRSRMPSSA